MEFFRNFPSEKSPKLVTLLATHSRSQSYDFFIYSYNASIVVG
jgi:hypothetical protein